MTKYPRFGTFYKNARYCIDKGLNVNYKGGLL